MKLSFVVFCAVTVCLALCRVVPASSPGPKLARRFDSETLADDEKWEDARCKGGKLVELMLLSDAEAGPRIVRTKDRKPPSARSDWQGGLNQELRTWGWKLYNIENAYGDMSSWQVQSVIDALKINGKPKAEGGNNIPYDVEHWDANAEDDKGKPIDKKDQKYKVDGKEYRVTGARHVFTVNPTDGVILGQFLENPATAARRLWFREPKKDELPALRKLSDILWGYWNWDNQNVANIRYFWMMDIANEDTEEILARALSKARKEYDVWPGVTFNIDTDAGNAILGSPNGAVFAWFMIQHKAQLGNKWISKVTVFNNDSGAKWNGAHLLFHVDAWPKKEGGQNDANIVAGTP